MNYQNHFGEEISVLGYGCMRFPKRAGKTDLVKSEKQILRAVEQGVNYFDTAYLYPESEASLGYIVERNNLRKNIKIASKLPLMFVRSYEDFDKFFNITLKRLKTDYIDYYLMHNMCTISKWKELVELGIEDWIHKQKCAGRIRNVGFSSHGTESEFLGLLDVYNWDFCQIQYNYMNENYQAGTKGLKAAAKKGIMVVIMEPLLGGKLAHSLPPQAVKLINDKFKGKTPAETALGWLWNKPEVAVVLSGMNSDEQIDENVGIASAVTPNSLPKEEVDEYPNLINAFRSGYKIPCTGCNYCQPCPKNVDIADLFSAYNMSYALGRFEGIKQFFTGHLGRPSSVSLCVQCRKCEEHCPQNIKIADEVKRASKRIQPWFINFISLAAGRLVLKRKRKHK